ncbi:MAG: hypothetical protein IT359_19745 [Gemmatimonadaceae bacterium]|nr:hypothetical protein [Gemmatimonadaceae bacterium]
MNDMAALKFFSRTGALQRVVGRRGAGPGEFQQVREICVMRGDSLLVIDAATGRFTLWDSAGRLVATHMRFAYVPSGACTANGTLITRSAGAAVVSRKGRSVTQYDEFKPDGTRVRSVGLLPQPPISGPIIQELRLGSAGNTLWIGDPQAGELWISKLPLAVHTIVRMLDPRPAITEEVWRREIESRFGTAPVPRAQRERVTERLMKVPRPAFDPAFLEMRVDPDGRAWISDYRDRARWTVFDALGGLVGQLVLPPFTDPASPQLAAVLSRGRVALLARTADGFPELRIHAVELPRGATREESGKRGVVRER